MLTSFRSRLIALLLVLLALVQLGTALAVLSSLKKDNYRQGVHTIDVARNVFDLFLDSRADQLTKGVEILASDFGFKQAVATQEIATIQSVLDNHGARIGADVSLLVSPLGKMITTTKELDVEQTVSHLVQAARRSGGSAINTMISYKGQAYQLVLVPVKAPNTIAWVGMAFLLDQKLAEQIKAVTGLEVSFIGDSADHKYYSGFSTLPEQDKTDLFKEINTMEGISTSPQFTNSDKYLSLGIDLETKNQWGVLHLPFKPWLESYNHARNQLLLIFSGALLLALIVGVLLARNLTSPIERLVEFARQIGLVGRDAKAPDVSGEFKVLSNTMMSMQTAISIREEELTYRASHDINTGLFNRSAVEQYLSEILHEKQGSLVQVNIRHFKDINNMLGFDNGDVLLLKTAERLKTFAPEAKMLARIGGDEFVMVFNYEMTIEKCWALRACFEEEFSVSGESKVHLGVCIGVLSFQHALESANDAMRRLDIATDEAKESASNFAFYQAGQDESHQRQLRIIGDLSEALELGQMFVVYQPKVSVASKDCNEAEALIRWRHPILGFIPPDEFIFLLEQAGNIQELTHWVIKTVLKQLQEWWSAGHQIRVAINLSAHDLVNENLPEFIHQALLKNHLPATALALEVTESAVMTDRRKVIQVLKDLQAMGIHLAIDDFGTGQSSLAYLRELPVNEVKIDRTFIQHMDINKKDEFIVKTSIDLSHSLGFEVTAEGVENEQSVALLGRYQCNKIQGYYFSKPLVADEFLQWKLDNQSV